MKYLTFIWDFLVFLFTREKKSNDEKLGIAETTAQSQAAALKEVQDVEKIKSDDANQPSGGALDWLRAHSHNND